MIRTLVFAGILLACLFGAQGTPAAAAGSLDECSKIQDDAARLRCYDEMAGRKPREAATETDVSPCRDRESGSKGHALLPFQEVGARRGEPSTPLRHHVLQAKLHPALHVQLPPGKTNLRGGKPGHGDRRRRDQVPAQPQGETLAGHPRDEHGPLVRLHAAVPLAVLQHGVLLPLSRDKLRARDPAQLPDRHGHLRPHEKPVHPGRLNHQSNGRGRAPLPELESDRGQLRFRAG